MPLLHIVSLGCTKNLVDSEVMLARLKEFTITDNPSTADVIIVNTCGFINAAKEESINTILSLHKQRKNGSLLVMAGCLSERYKAELQATLTEVDLFTGVGDYAKIEELISGRKNSFSDRVFLQQNEDRVITNSGYHAYIKIAEGCNQRCSFCAIPTFKGKLQSRSIQSITAEVERLIERGYFDFTLIAQDSSSFGRDRGKKDDLIKLIREIDTIGGVKRARMCYLYPSTTSRRLIDTIALSRHFAPYFDIPIQHASDRMLKVMKRGMGIKKTLDLIGYMRAVPNSYVRTAFIVGHPKEEEGDFNAIGDLIDDDLFDRATLFAFSDEEGSAANKMKYKNDLKTINTRLQKGRNILKKMHKKRLKKYIGKVLSAVVEKKDDSGFFIEAKALNFAPEIDPKILINQSDKTLKTKDIVSVKIIDTSHDLLIARALKDGNG
ncbi:MAG: 30S ribosomal protein S12 methylthiotransferase RimO [Helicobacteraceae bacterium]|nr:30S ribosomal protein S12 methylthiotransferase RimO [Helicobacteraceae bacterium]